MAEPETDGIAEVFDDGMRLAITAAGRPAEQRIRERERQLREAQAESDQTARELQGRIDGAAAFGLAEWLSVMAVCRVVCRSPAQRSSPSGRGAIWSAKRTAGLGHKPPLRIYEVSSFLSICCLIPRRKRRQHEQLAFLEPQAPRLVLFVPATPRRSRVLASKGSDTSEGKCRHWPEPIRSTRST